MPAPGFRITPGEADRDLEGGGSASLRSDPVTPIVVDLATSPQNNLHIRLHTHPQSRDQETLCGEDPSLIAAHWK